MNSVFTRMFIKNLVKPGLNLYELARATRRDVVKLASTVGHDQVPAFYDQIVGDPIYLAGRKPGNPDAGTSLDGSPDMAALKARLKAMADQLQRQKRKGETKVAVGVFPEKSGVTPKSNYNPGDEFQDCDVCPKMVVLPSGSFMMGSPKVEKGREDNEGPQRRVTLSYSFAAGKFEVTFAEWDACVSGGGCQHKPRDAGWGRDRRPVINVSWNDAKSYLSWLSRKTGKTYRLLSEAEWEYAARANTTTPFYTGRTITTSQANFDGNRSYNGSQKGRYRKQTIAVGSFPANAFGLHDVLGNVSEWVEDCWEAKYADAPNDGSPSKSGNCDRHIVRGGSWFDRRSWLIRSASRRYSFNNTRLRFNGFRVARTLKP